VRPLLAAILLIVIAAPRSAGAAACEYRPGETVKLTGTYVPSGQAYARTFAFALQMECGSRDLITVQRPTGNLPVCEPQQQVEVAGKLIWNRSLVDGHYEINSPSSVTCVPGTRASVAASTPAIASTPAAPPAAPARTIGPSVWVGRYQDSRGAGDVTFTIVRGESTVSGTWKLRTGGGGPITGLIDGSGRRMQLRMENLAPECPGTFEGLVDLSQTSLSGSYRGKDCEGAVTDGRLDLRPQ